MQETWVQPLVWEDPLEKGMAAHSSTLSWRIPWTGEPGGLQSIGCKESDTTERLTQHNIPLCIVSRLLYPFICCWMTFSFLGCVGCWKWCFGDCAYPRVGFLGVMVSLFSGFRSLPATFIVASQIYTPTNSVQGFCFIPFSPIFVICRLSMIAILIGGRW